MRGTQVGVPAAGQLGVQLGIGTYTMSTLANRLTDAPLDNQLSPFAWHTAAAWVNQLG